MLADVRYGQALLCRVEVRATAVSNWAAVLSSHRLRGGREAMALRETNMWLVTFLTVVSRIFVSFRVQLIT